MAFPLVYALRDSDVAPIPVAPRIAAVCRRRVLTRVAAGGSLWAIAGAMLGFVWPFEFHWLTAEPGGEVGALVLFFASAVYALVAVDGIGPDVARGFCRGRLAGIGDFRRVVGPIGTVATALTGLLGWLCVGVGAAAVIRLVRGEPGAAAALAGLLALVALLFCWALVRARRAWSAARRARGAQAAVVAYGRHVVGRIGSVRPQGLWFEEQPSFLADLDYEIDGEPVEQQLVLWDHAIWAPLVGNEFDVWYDPAAPHDLTRTFIERRYVGQRFTDRPEDFRVPEGDEWPAGALAPAWLTEERRSGVGPSPWTAIAPTLVGLVALAAAAVTPRLVDVSWWTTAALALLGVLTLANAVTAWRFVIRGRAFVHSGHTFEATAIRCRAGVLTVAAATLADSALVWRSLTGEVPWTAGQLPAAVALLLGLTMYPWRTGLDQRVRELNAVAPPELVREALTGHDDLRIDRLEREHGYAASRFLLTA